MPKKELRTTVQVPFITSSRTWPLEKWRLTEMSTSPSVCSSAHKDEEKFFRRCQDGPLNQKWKKMVKRSWTIIRSNWLKSLLEKQLRVNRCSVDLWPAPKVIPPVEGPNEASLVHLAHPSLQAKHEILKLPNKRLYSKNFLMSAISMEIHQRQNSC